MISMPISKVAEVLNVKYSGNNAVFLGCSIDTRTIKENELFVALPGKFFDGHDYVQQAKEGGACAVLTEQKNNISIPTIVVKNTRLAMGELARHWRTNFSIPLVAITGSNGKTSVRKMLASILRCQSVVLETYGNFNNNIGLPLTLFRLANTHQYGVVELGANHLEEIAQLTQIAQPTIAVITQCAPTHLEGFGSVENVAYAKSEIFTGLSNEGTAVINGDDRFADLWLEKSQHAKQVTFGMQVDNHVYATDLRVAADKSFFQLVSPVGNVDLELSVPGQHNVMNALAAATCAIELGVSLEVIKQGLDPIKTSPGRLHISMGIKGCRIIDDTYNANPRSLVAALDTLSKFPGRHWLVLGDMAELGEEAQALHAQAGEISKQSKVERLYGLGDLTKFSVHAFGARGVHVEDISQLAMLLIDELDAGVTILIKGSRSMHLERLLSMLGVTEILC